MTEFDISVGSDAGDEDSAMRGLANKNIVSKPGKCPLDASEFDDWRFDLEIFMAVVHFEYATELETALTTDLNPGEVLTDTTSPSLRKRSILLYGVLCNLTKGRIKLIMKQFRKSKNGYHCWRLINQEFNPQQSDSLKLSMSLDLSNGTPFKNMKEGEFQQALLTWESNIEKYEAFGTPFDPVLKRAVLLKYAPPALATHMRVTTGGTASYSDMRTAIESYCRNVGSWNLGDSRENDPMDVGGFGDKSKGKGKGKDKGKGKKGGKQGDGSSWQPSSPSDSGCYRCGSQKHRGFECKHWESTCNICGRRGHIGPACRSKDKPLDKGKGGKKGKDGKNSDRDSGKGKQATGVGAIEEQKTVADTGGSGAGANSPTKPKYDVDGKLIGCVDELVWDQTTTQMYDQDWVLGAFDDLDVTIDEQYEADWVFGFGLCGANLIDGDDSPPIKLEKLAAEDSDEEWRGDDSLAALEGDDSLSVLVGAFSASEGKKELMMVDSGAGRSLFRPGAFEATMITDNSCPLAAVNGSEIKKYGSQKP